MNAHSPHTSYCTLGKSKQITNSAKFLSFSSLANQRSQLRPSATPIANRRFNFHFSSRCTSDKFKTWNCQSRGKLLVRWSRIRLRAFVSAPGFREKSTHALTARKNAFPHVRRLPCGIQVTMQASVTPTCT